MAKYATCPFKVGDILEVRDAPFSGPSGLPENPLIVASITGWGNHSGWCVELERGGGKYDVDWFKLTKTGILKRILDKTE